MVKTIQSVIIKKGSNNWLAVTLSNATPAKMTPVTKKGAIVVPKELMAQTMFIRCTGCVPGSS